MMAELKTRVEELKMENEYQLRLKDMNYNEKIKELTEKFIQEMESLKTKNQVLKTDKEKEEAKHEEEICDVREKHSRELQVSTSWFLNTIDAWRSTLRILLFYALWKRANFIKLHILSSKHKPDIYNEYLTQSVDCVAI